MRRLSLTLFVSAFLLLTTVQAQQSRFQFDPDISYNPSIQSPAEFLGYELGDEYTFHHNVVSYFQYLEENSDRITVDVYGETYEGRELIYAVVTSEENQQNIATIRAENLELTDPSSNTPIEGRPIVTWLSYNVHGNEASSSEAAMQTAYRLVAGTDAETGNMLEHSVVILDPMLNPDGRDRYVYWYKSSRANILNTDWRDLEHDEIWPGGRTNHYWFDLNRDWVWLIHPESRGRIAAYQQWMPQVHLDLHEQGFNSNYFTMPGTTPKNLELPDDYTQWTDVFGRGVIEEFDKHNVNYATREAFDFFYPGYGSSYPSIMGGIGMLAEQGGHSRGGRAVETEDGYVLTLRQRVFDHYTNSIATVRTSVENREGLLNYFKRSFTEETKKGPEEAYILRDNPNDYTYDVVNMLLKHGIEVHQAGENFSTDAFSYWDGQESRRSFSAGDFIIPADQPKHLFVNTLFNHRLAIEDSVMYDMSTWSVPQAYNLDAAWVEDDLGVNTTRVTTALGNPSGVENADAEYAFVVDWNQRNAPKALAMLWEEDYRVRTAWKTFRKGDKSFSRGSLVVLIGRNYDKRNTIAGDMQRIADEAGVKIVGFDTGRMDEGMDLASRSSNPVHQPKVALMVDSPFNSYTAGQLWFLFDQWTEFGISRLRADALNFADLSEYDVILMPGSWGGLGSTLGERQRERLKDWIQGGGTLVATEQSAEFFTKTETEFSSVELANRDEDEEEEKDTIAPDAYTRFEALEDTAGLKRIPGSSFKGIVDNSHPVGFGMPEQIYSLKFSTESFKPSSDYRVIGYYHKDAGDVLASGYASPENKEKLAGNAFAVHQSMGSGNLILLLDNTQYRMFWVGPARMIQNAVMLVGGNQ